MTLTFGYGPITAQVPLGSTRTIATEYRETLELCSYAESLGFERAWVSEHHGAADSYLPSLTVLMAAILATTKRLGVSMGVGLAPLQHPLRFAEDCAVLDQIAPGRVAVGLAAGWRDEEFRAFNTPKEERVRRTVELIEICRQAWSGERFDYVGDHWEFAQVAVRPPSTRPIPIYMGASAERSSRRAGRIADGLVVSRGEISRASRLVDSFAEGAAEAGFTPFDKRLAVVCNLFVSDDGTIPPIVEAAIWHHLGTYEAWRTTDKPGVPFALPSLDSKRVVASTIYGTPDVVLRKLSSWVSTFRNYDLELVCRFHYPGMTMEDAKPAMNLFSQSVMPGLRSIAVERS